MRSAFDAGVTEKEAGPLGRRSGLDQRVDAGSRGKESGPASDTARSNPMRREGTKTPGKK